MQSNTKHPTKRCDSAAGDVEWLLPTSQLPATLPAPLRRHPSQLKLASCQVQHRLTAYNLAEHDANNALNKHDEERAWLSQKKALQKAAIELGFGFEDKSFAIDERDLDGWLASQTSLLDSITRR